MALSTFDGLYRGLLLRCPAASLMLARSWIDFSFRQIVGTRLWSWMRKRGQFLLPQATVIGVVNVTRGNVDVQGVGTSWGGGLVNQQFRVGTQSPIYTIISVDNANQVITLDAPWGGLTILSAGYVIYQAYVTVPTDFQNFISVWDANFNWQLNLYVTQEELNLWDAQRANSGTSYCVASYAYSSGTANTPPLPMYELWPHQRSQYVYPFLYTSQPPDLSDSGAFLPRYIRGDVLMEFALAQAARWPGPSADLRNPYFNLQLAQTHELRARDMLVDLARTDDEIVENDVTYNSVASMPFAAIPYGDARWIQAHDVG